MITIVHFVFREEIQVNQNTNTSRDFVAWNSWRLKCWACYRGCGAKGKKSWRCCLVRKYVRYTKMTPVIYFALQTLNNKEFYYANLIFQKRAYDWSYFLLPARAIWLISILFIFEWTPLSQLFLWSVFAIIIFDRKDRQGNRNNNTWRDLFTWNCLLSRAELAIDSVYLAVGRVIKPTRM